MKSPFLRLICFPHAGGNSSAYRAWGDALPDGVEVCAVELPGRLRRFSESLITDMEQLLDELELEIIELNDVPMVFFGHSFGGLVAYELTRQLEKHNRALPMHVLISGSRPPHLRAQGDLLHVMPDEILIDRLSRLGGIPTEILGHRELLSLVMPAIRGDITMAETWVSPMSEPLMIPMTIFGGKCDESVSQDELIQWSEYTRSCVEIHMFDGDHFYLKDKEKELLDIISRKLSLFVRYTRLSA